MGGDGDAAAGPNDKTGNNRGWKSQRSSAESVRHEYAGERRCGSRLAKRWRAGE